MVNEIYNSGNRKMSLNITITCNGKKKFRVWAEELGKRNSKYAEREIIVENSRVIYFSFPVSPKQLFIGCGDVSAPQSKDFSMKIEEAPLKTYDIWMDEDTEKFVQLDVIFSQKCGFEQPAPQGTMYSTKDGMYNIKNFPVIKDALKGRPLSTPARVGHRTGIIEVSSVKFAKYTIPMRICILLHEFSHKFKNPNIGLQINNEIGADINALYIYLGLGFSKVDAICVFANVFLKAQSEGNIQRMRKILDYINRFEQQEFAQIA